MISGSSPSKRTSTTGPMTCGRNTPSLASAPGPGSGQTTVGYAALVCLVPPWCGAASCLHCLRSPVQHSRCPKTLRALPQRQTPVCLLCAQSAAAHCPDGRPAAFSDHQLVLQHHHGRQSTCGKMTILLPFCGPAQPAVLLLPPEVCGVLASFVVCCCFRSCHKHVWTCIQTLLSHHSHLCPPSSKARHQHAPPCASLACCRCM